jgi:hypothetical protein
VEQAGSDGDDGEIVELTHEGQEVGQAIERQQSVAKREEWEPAQPARGGGVAEGAPPGAHEGEEAEHARSIAPDSAGDQA